MNSHVTMWCETNGELQNNYSVCCYLFNFKYRKKNSGCRLKEFRLF